MAMEKFCYFHMKPYAECGCGEFMRDLGLTVRQPIVFNRIEAKKECNCDGVCRAILNKQGVDGCKAIFGIDERGLPILHVTLTEEMSKNPYIVIPERKHDQRCGWLALDHCTCSELRFVDAIDRDVTALYATWDERKLNTKKRKAAENNFSPARHLAALERQDRNEDAVARAFAFDLPAESERQDYLSPYRMRG